MNQRRWSALLAIALLLCACGKDSAKDVNSDTNDVDNDASEDVNASDNNRDDQSNDASTQPAPDGSIQSSELTVMTWNLYVGTDLASILEALVNHPSDVPALVTQALSNIAATDFPQRASRIAEEIEKTKPQVIGLQEVSLICLLPGDRCLDYLQILQSKLVERNLAYDVAAVFRTQPVALPTSVPGVLASLVDRNVILVKKEQGLSFTNPLSGSFSTKLEIRLPDNSSVSVDRGWASVDLSVGNETGRLVNTHLEASDIPLLANIQVAQATELVFTFARQPLPIVLVGDFNSPADQSGTPTYELLTFAGYTDGWLLATPPKPGFTCCQSADLLNEESSLAQRIDFIFLKNFDLLRSKLVSVRAQLVGANQSSKTASGLWPSNHAGVVETLQFASDLPESPANLP